MIRAASLALALGVLGASAPLAEEWFVDATESSGLDFVHFNGMSGRLYYPEVVGSGSALFDADGDGDLDLYLVQGAMLGPDLSIDAALFPYGGVGAPNDRLLRNDLGDDGRARFVDITENSGIASTGYGMGVVAGDYNGDGKTDLYVLNLGANALFRNLGDGRFEDVTQDSGLADESWSVSGTFTDYDGDGDLDLAWVNYLNFSFIAHKTCLTERGEEDYCLPSAYFPVFDRLFENVDGRFVDRSEAAGWYGASPGNGLGVVSGDLDGDGLTDFYVANDLQPNHLWLNQGEGRFLEDGLPSGSALNRDGKAEASMGLDAGDYDGDGDLDLFMTHFVRETNTLYRNDGTGFFSDVTGASGLGRPSWDFTSFGTRFADFDGDGRLDLLVLNGAVTFAAGEARSESNPFPLDQPNQLFRNTGGRFVEVTAEAGEALALSEVSRGAAVGDIDNDGDLDVVVTNNSGPARLLLNEVGSRGGWVGIAPRVGRRPGLGALVEVTAGEASWTRRAHSDGGYATASDPRVLVALPSGVDSVRVDVHWPEGLSETWKDVPVGQYTEVIQGQGQGRPEGSESRGRR